MTTPLGEEFIRIRPDASTFRAELQAQIAAAMQGVAAQTAAAQTQLSRVAATSTFPGVVSVGGGARSATAQVQRQATAAKTATAGLGTAAQATTSKLSEFNNVQRKVASTTQGLKRDILQAETAAGRYTRGMVAATAASTGFFRAVSFASGAFLLGAVAGATIGSAVQEFSNMTTVAAQTAAVLKATGGAANVTAKQVDALAQSQLKLTGIDDELIKQSANVLLTFRLIRNEIGAGNDIFNRAVKATLDISSVFRTDLRGSAVQLGKALQDPVRGVTALRRSGITLSQSQRDLIAEMVKSGRILSAQKIILGEVERQVGGTAAAIGKTLPGQLRIMKEEALNTLGDYVKRVTESRQASELLAQAQQGIAQAFGAVRSVVQAIGPALADIAGGLGRATQAIGGAGVLLAGIVAYKGLILVIRAATTAQTLYAAATLQAAQAQITEAVSAGASTAKIEALTAASLASARSAQATFSVFTGLSAAMSIGAAASGHWTLAMIFAGGTVLGVATKVRAAVTALRAAGTAVTALRVASLAFGGSIGLAAIGVGALAVGLFKLAQAAGNSSDSMARTKQILDGLNKSIEENLRLRAAVGTAREQVGVARFDLAAAQRDVQRAQQALAGTPAAAGSNEFLFLQQQVALAIEKREKATKALLKAEADLTDAQNVERENAAKQPSELERITNALQKNIAAVKTAALGARFSPQGTAINRPAQLEVDDLIERFTKLRDTYKGSTREAAKAVLAIAKLNKIPAPKDIEVIIRLAARGQNVDQILRQLGITKGRPITQADLEQKAVQRLNADLGQEHAKLKASAAEAYKKLVTIRQELAKRKEAKAIADQELQSAKDAVTSAKEARQAAIEGLAQAEQSLADARQNLADTIRESHRAVADAITAAHDALNQSIQDAKSNLEDIGQAIAEALGKAADAGDTAGSRLSERVKQIRQQILHGGGPEITRIAQQIKFGISAKVGTVDTDKLKQQFADLVGGFTRGTIALPEATKRFNALVKGVNFGAIAKTQGTEAAARLRDEIAFFRAQMRIIAESPQRAGGAIAEKLVNPLNELRKGQIAIADARRQAARDIANSKRDLANSVDAVKKAELGIVKADRDLRATERRLRIAQTKATNANTKAQQQQTKETKTLRIWLQAHRALFEPKPKPNGRQTQEANDAKAGIGR